MKTTGQKIKELRTDLKMSQEELGEKIGVQKAAINKYETGIVTNLKRTIIAKLSEALNTTPSYLMGWEEESAVEDKTDIVLTDAEKEIIKMYRNVSVDAQKFIYKTVKAQQEPVSQNKEAQAEVDRVVGEIDEFVGKHFSKSFSAL